MSDTERKSPFTHDDSSRNGANLQQVRSEPVTMSPEFFEKLYLSPESRVKGELRMTFGNPTPMALAGLVLCITPLACEFMQWRGATGDGASTIGSFYFMGGMLSILGAIGEFILGNSFSTMVFGIYGSFFLTFAATLQPAYNAYGAFSPDPNNPSAGIMTTPFLSGVGFLGLFMALFSFFVMICAVRTNAVFTFVFVCLTNTFSFFAASNFYGAEGNMDLFHKYRVTTGAFSFAACMAGWYLFFALALTTVDMPFNLPIGDLSTVIMSGAEKAKRRQAKAE